MAKRFTDTEKWFDSWFRELPTDYKLFWIYLCDRCNNAGVWKIDIKLFNLANDLNVNAEEAFRLYGDRIVDLRPGYWLVRGFVSFQYGDLSPNNRYHASVLALLEKEGASKALLRPLIGPQDKDIDKDMDKDNGRGTGKPERVADKFNFEVLWARYPRREGKKEALRHFNASVKTVQDWLDIQNALDNYIRQLRLNHTTLEYTKMGSTWFNNWRDYVNYAVDKNQVNRPPAAPPKPRDPLPPEPDLTKEDKLEMHAQTVAALKRCSSGPSCAICKEIEESKRVVADAVAKAAGKKIEKSALEGAGKEN